MAFTGKIEVNGKTFTYKPSEAGTRAVTLEVPKSGTLRITKVVFKKCKNLILGKGNKMQVQVLPTNAKVTKVTWMASSSSSIELAKPRKKGDHHNMISTCVVTPKKKKTFKITCTAKGYGRYIKSYKVKTVYADAKKVEISYNNTKVESLTFTEGDQPKQLKATVTPSNAYPNVTWTSSNDKVATVDKNGTVTPKGAGTATITCTAKNNKKATCTVTVNAAEKSISSVTINNSKLSENKLTLVAGSSEAFTATVGPEKATETDKTVKWSVTDDWNGGDVVTITTATDGTCTVTANHEGTATLTATAGKNNVSASVTITVTAQTNTVSPSGGYKNGGDPTNPGGGA